MSSSYIFFGTLKRRVALGPPLARLLLSAIVSVTLEKINWLWEMGAIATFTLNEHYFSDYRQNFLESYRNAGAEDDVRRDEDVTVLSLRCRSCTIFRSVVRIARYC